MKHPDMLDKVQNCQKIIGYEFKDHDLCWEALQAAGNGVASSGPRRFANGSKRLAILGNFVLGLILSQKWYDSGATEEAWTTIQQNFLTNAKLGNLESNSELGGCVQLGNGQSNVSTKMMATTVEALIGAAYLDGGDGAGLSAVREIVNNLGIASQTPPAV